MAFIYHCQKPEFELKTIVAPVLIEPQEWDNDILKAQILVFNMVYNTWLRLS